MEIALCLQSVAVVDRQATFTDTSTEIRSMKVPSLCGCHGRQATFTDTATWISSMEIALFLQSVAVVDRQATFTDTSIRISSMEIALCLQGAVGRK